MNSDSSSPRAGVLSREARRLLTQELMPTAAFISLPVPLLREGALAASFFAAMAITREDNTNEDIFAPAAEITLDWATGRQLDLRVLRAATPPAEETPVAAIRPLAFQLPLTDTLKEQLRGQFDRLYELLEPVVRRYAATPQRPPMDDATRYLEQFEDLVPRAARVYYTALNPDFFAWVEGGR